MERVRAPYTAEISRTNPACFLFLVDQSGSMRLPFGEARKRKSEALADSLNRLFMALVSQCCMGREVYDRYYVGVIGYADTALTALGGNLAGRGMVKISQLANNPLRVETRTSSEEAVAGGLADYSSKLPIWVEAVAQGRTSMCEALRLGCTAVREFVETARTSFPPIVINITDGEANDGDPEPEAAALRSLATADGNVLLFNAHISSLHKTPIRFPSTEDGLPDEHARRLFRMSSPLPARMVEEAYKMEIPITEGARGFVFNADLISLLYLLDIGTRVAKQEDGSRFSGGAGGRSSE